jgi:FMN phosphatase YigB (HAD superfamily)
MGNTLHDYADWLADRNLVWPAAPKRVPINAKSSANLLVGVRAVAFSVYGTLLRISDGELLQQHPQAVRMEIALDKTIKEFNMWNSMTRRPGAPWEGMVVRYARALDERRMATTHAPGEFPEVDSAVLWMKLIRQLQQKEYSYDASFYGDLEEFAEKVAYFFHSSLQGLEAEEGALEVLRALPLLGKRVGLVANGQRFTPVQMLRAFQRQGTLRSLDELFDPALVTLSCREGIRKPSKSLYQRALERFRRMGVAPHQVLYVGTRLRDDVAVAKQAGMRTALLAVDQTSFTSTREELADPELRPERLLTNLAQVREVAGH